MLRGAPLTGIGIGVFPFAFHERVPVSSYNQEVLIPHVHDVYLQAALDLGLFGSAAFVALLAGAIVAAYRAGRRLEGPAAGAAFGLAAGLIAFALFGLFDAVTLTSRTAGVIWYAIGLATASERALAKS